MLDFMFSYQKLNTVATLHQFPLFLHLGCYVKEDLGNNTELCSNTSPYSWVARMYSVPEDTDRTPHGPFAQRTQSLGITIEDFHRHHLKRRLQGKWER